MKKNTITHGWVVLSFIVVTSVVASFLITLTLPVHPVKADISDFLGDVYFGVKGQQPDSSWTLYTKVTKGGQSSNWHYQTRNNFYNEYAEFGQGEYRIEAEHRIFSTQEVKARGWVEVDFIGDPIRKDIITVPEKELE